MQSIALPTLTYALEALALTKMQIVSLEHPWSRRFKKLFKTFNQAIVQQCQYCSNLLPVRHVYALHRMGFLTEIETSNNLLLRHIYTIANNNNNVITNVADRYCCSEAKFVKSYQTVVRTQFKFETVNIE